MSRGLSISVSMSLADQRTNYLHSGSRLRYRSLFDARPENWIGIGLPWTEMSNQYARNQRYMNTIGAISDYNVSAYHPVPGHSLNGEFYYRFRPVSWLALQPGIQY